MGETMPARKQVAPELLAEAKFLYEQTLTPVHEIGKRLGFSRSAFYLRVKEWGWQQRRYTVEIGEGMPALILPQPAVEASSPASGNETVRATTPPDETESAFEIRARTYAKACRAVGRQIEIIEGIQSTLMPTQPAQSERTARVLALLNKSLLEITATTEPESTADDEADDDDPRDIDAYRRDLARRLQGLVEVERQREGPGTGGVEEE
jgi:hypothetical protein